MTGGAGGNADADAELGGDGDGAECPDPDEQAESAAMSSPTLTSAAPDPRHLKCTSSEYFLLRRGSNVDFSW